MMQVSSEIQMLKPKKCFTSTTFIQFIQSKKNILRLTSKKFYLLFYLSQSEDIEVNFTC